MFTNVLFQIFEFKFGENATSIKFLYLLNIDLIFLLKDKN